MEFLHEYSISWVEDSSNGTDQFLRNRVRHHLMPILEQENPCFAVNTSAMALRLREDEAALSQMAASQPMAVSALRNLSAACRGRALCGFLERAGVREPEAEHLALLERIVFSGKPSARASFPNGVTIRRNYDSLEVESGSVPVPERLIACPGVTGIPEIGLAVHCKPASPAPSTGERYFLPVSGALVLRQREEGDSIRLSGGTKSLKKLFIDKKIPAAKRQSVPILADAGGLLAVYGIGVNLDRLSDKGQWFEITFEPIEPSPIL